METYEAILSTLALSLGASWASGINLYAVLLVLGLGGASGNIALPDELMILENPIVIAAAGLMYCVEFFADKIPGVDTGWDTLHTFIRIPAGALIAAGAVGEVAMPLELAAAIVGGGLASASHATKAGTRMLINTSPEPVTNIGASISEDLLVLGGLWAALNHPLIFLGALILFIIFAAWALPKLWRLIKKIFLKIGQFLGLVDKHKSSGNASENIPPSHSPSSSTNRDSLEELERLNQLKKDGALTEDEFAKLKQKALNP